MTIKPLLAVGFTGLLWSASLSATSMIAPQYVRHDLALNSGESAQLLCLKGGCSIVVRAGDQKVTISSEQLSKLGEIRPSYFQIYSEIDGFTIESFAVEVGVKCKKPTGGTMCIGSVTVRHREIENFAIIKRTFTDGPDK